MARQLWWMMHKDLLVQWRTRRGWLTTLLLGTIVVAMFSLQVDLPPEHKGRVAGGLLWLAVVFAAVPTLDRSLAAECEDGCWQGLLRLPIAPAGIYLSKLLVNLVWLTAVECLLIPLFVALCELPLLAHPWAMAQVALLASLGIAAVGTLLGAVTAPMRGGAALLVLLVVPALVPVVLAASEATRLLVEEGITPQWWQWNALLAAFAATFVVVATLLFEFVLEDQAHAR